jgi:ACS family hexuronate transporter-like MFS transporter
MLSSRTTALTTRNLRWVFLALTFVITMVGYADRQVLALLKPALDATFGWTGGDYGLMTTAFQIAIAVSLLFAGWFLDRVGLRAGFAIGLAGWSVASGLHALCRTVPEFVAARAALGVFEAVGTPAGMKALATFFGPAERAMVIGIANIAPNIATVVTPLLVSALYVGIGWQGTILMLALFGFVCVALWLALPMARMEAAAIRDLAPATGPMVSIGAPSVLGDRVAAHVPVWRDRQAWVLALAKLLTDQAWWFFLFWLPDFMHRQFALDMRHLGPPVATIYAMAAAGSLLGGIVPRLLMAAGLGAAPARSVAMLGFALCVAPILLVTLGPTLWQSVLLIGLALAAHQGFATNLFALAADLYPAARIGQVIGFAAFFGNIGGAASARLAGFLLQTAGSVAPMFFVCAAGYPLAWLALRLLLPPRTGNEGMGEAAAEARVSVATH